MIFWGDVTWLHLFIKILQFIYYYLIFLKTIAITKNELVKLLEAIMKNLE